MLFNTRKFDLGLRMIGRVLMLNIDILPKILVNSSHMNQLNLIFSHFWYITKNGQYRYNFEDLIELILNMYILYAIGLKLKKF